MSTRKPILAGILLLTMICLFAAERRFNKSKSPQTKGSALPPAVDEYKRIMARYLGADSDINLSGTIRIYDGENKFSLREEKGFHYSRKGGQFFAQLSRLQTFCDGKLVLQLDTLAKSVIVNKAPSGRLSIGAPTMQPFDRLFSDTARFRFSGEVSGQGVMRTLRIVSDFSPEIRSFSLIYDTATYRLSRAEVEFWKRGTLPGDQTADRIWLAKIEYHYGVPAVLEMEKKIRQVVGLEHNGIRLRDTYKDYQLTTNLN